MLLLTMVFYDRDRPWWWLHFYMKTVTVTIWWQHWKQYQADLLWIPSTSDYNLHKAWLKVFHIFVSSSSSSMYCIVYPGEFWEAYKGGVGDYWGRKCSSTSRHSKGDHDQWLMSKEKSDIWTKDAIALQSRLDMTNLFPDAHSSQCSVKLAPSRPPSPWRCLCQVMMRTINGSDPDHHDNDLPTK